MKEGKTIIGREFKGSHRYRVDTDVIDGNMRYVGVFWPEPDYSPEAKRRSTVIKEWWARQIGSGLVSGPYASRKAAAEALYC